MLAAETCVTSDEAAKEEVQVPPRAAPLLDILVCVCVGELLASGVISSNGQMFISVRAEL